MRRIVPLFLTVLLAVSCGSASHNSDWEKPFFDVETRKANRLAPDLVARAQSAHNESLLAKRRGQNLAAQQYSTSARLLLEAAKIEAERIEIERQRKKEQKRFDRAKLLQIRHLRARQNVEREIALFKAVQDAKSRDSLDDNQTTDGSIKHNRRWLRQAAHKRAIELAIKRARLYLASAVAMGADDKLLEKARHAISEAQYQPVGSASSERKAEQALFSALDALSSARANYDGPTRDEKTTLLNEARNEGLSAELLPTGLVVELTKPFVGPSSALNNRGRVEIKKLQYLVRAHPHGAIEIRLHAGSTDRPDRKRLANARASRMVSSLSTDKSQRSRFNVAFDAFSPNERDNVKLIFVAYGRSSI